MLLDNKKKDYRKLAISIILEKCVKLANAVTVSSTFLQKRFGGTIIPHAKDTDYLNPEKWDGVEIRRMYQLGNKKVVMFAGTVREHKGLDDLILALNKIKPENICLVVMGVDLGSPYIKNLEKLTDVDTRFIERQPIEKLPMFLSAADIVVVPQKSSHVSRAQIPSKLFDAMAMAKPIVATNISDIANILDDCGLIVDPGNIDELALNIKKLIDNKGLRKQLGVRAREKCVNRYSYGAVRSKLFEVVEKVA